MKDKTYEDCRYCMEQKHTHTFTHYLTHKHTLKRIHNLSEHSLSLSLSLSLSNTHTDTLTQSLTPSISYTQSLSHSLTQSHSHTHLLARRSPYMHWIVHNLDKHSSGRSQGLIDKPYSVILLTSICSYLMCRTCYLSSQFHHLRIINYDFFYLLKNSQSYGLIFMSGNKYFGRT